MIASGSDVGSSAPRTTDDERRVLSAVVALAEREARPVRLRGQPTGRWVA